MDFGTVIVCLAGVFCFFGLPVLAWHKQRMTKLNRSRMDASEKKRIEALEREVASLRDTTTKYDMSVEHAMHELSQRLSAVERRMQAGASNSSEDAAPQTLKLGGGHG